MEFSLSIFLFLPIILSFIGKSIFKNYKVIKWVSVSESLPSKYDVEYLVCVKNKNKESGIPLQDIAVFTSDRKWVKGNTWEDVLYWSELPKSPF